MTYREQFFAVLAGRDCGRVPFFPDLTDWYVAMRTPPGGTPKYGPGEMIPDRDTAFHRDYGSPAMPAEFRAWTYLDFYRHFDWGVPVHLYDWYTVEYDGAEETTTVTGDRKIRRWRAPEGELTMEYTRAEDGSWCPTKLPVKTLHELERFRQLTARLRYVPQYERIRAALDACPGRVVLDLVLRRSPFGKLVHELMGVEGLTYALFDDPVPIREWMVFQEQHDLQLVALAAAAPDAHVVILSDHSDENLIAPPQYREYCLPYYRQAAARLHVAGKALSTHLDGNFKGYLPFLHETGFDILDGCTPFPMTNWRPAELAATVAHNQQLAWCGVPSTLFCQNVADTVILAAGHEILDSFRSAGAKLIFNVGDIVSPTANIHQVIKLGELAAAAP
ncbi:MAG: uroporphyrinogen decarboxylase family protein [bacterium]